MVPGSVRKAPSIAEGSAVTMSPDQQNYCSTRRELLAVIASLQHFRHYLLHVHVILRTDHHSLKLLGTFKKPEAILARWNETLAEFEITIQHRPGRIHSNADGLSRQNCKQCWGRVTEEPWVDELQRADECTDRILSECTASSCFRNCRMM